MATPRKRPEDKLKTGRPTIYDKKVAEKICMLVATTKKGLSDICRENDDLPDDTTVYQWRYTYPEFSRMYAAAKVLQGEILGEKVKETTEKILGYTYQDPVTGATKVDSGMVAALKMISDAEKWQAARLAPKSWGDKQIIETNNSVSDEERKELISLRAQLAEKNKSDY